MRIITMSPLKGGTAKTSTLINLAGFYAKKGKKVLMIGLDSQKNLSNFFEELDTNHEYNIYDVLVEETDINKAIYQSRFSNIDYVADSIRLGERNVQIDLFSLQEILQGVQKLYDYVLIDNAPVLTSGVRSSFMASTDIIITCELERFSVENIADMIKEIRKTNSKANIYIVPVKVVGNSKVHRQVRRMLENFVKQIDFLYITDSIPYSIEMTNRLYNDEILVHHIGISNAHRQLKRALENLAKEIG